MEWRTLLAPYKPVTRRAPCGSLLHKRKLERMHFAPHHHTQEVPTGGHDLAARVPSVPHELIVPWSRATDKEYKRPFGEFGGP